MLQLWPERTLQQRMPPTQEDACPLEKTVQSSRSHIQRNRNKKPGRRTSGKQRPLGIEHGNNHPREKPVVEPDPPYRIQTTQYDREEKIMIKVWIIETDGKE